MQKLISHGLKLLLITVCLLLTKAQEANAIVYQWQGGIGQWNDPMNWIPQAVPGPNDEVWVWGGEPRIQGINQVIVGSILIEPGASMVVYPQASLTIANFNLGPGIQNKGTVTNHGSILIQNMSGSLGSGIENYGYFVNLVKADLHISAVSQFAIRNYAAGEFRNNGDLILDNLDNHGIYNEGLVTNNGSLHLELCPLKHKWGIINLNNFKNAGTMFIERESQNSLEEGAIRTEGYLLNTNEIKILKPHRYGIYLKKGKLENGVFKGTAAARMDIDTCGTYGLHIQNNAEFRNYENARILTRSCKRIGIYCQGDVYNYGSIVMLDNNFSDLNISATGTVENHKSLTSGFSHTGISSFKAFKISGDLINKFTGRISSNERIVSLTGSTILNDGVFMTHGSAVHVIGGDKIENNGIVYDRHNTLDNFVVNNSVTFNDYPDSVQVGVPALNFLDVASYDYVDILKQVKFRPAPPAAAFEIGHYLHGDNSVLIDSAGIGIQEIAFSASVKNSGLSIAYRVEVAAPITALAPNPPAQQRNRDIDQKPTLSVYPNPSSDILYVKGLEMETLKFSIFDINGQLMKSGRNGHHNISVQDLHPGYYILQINHDGILKNQSFIKK